MITNWIIAGATVVYAVCTLWLILEMRRDRKLAYMPFIKVTFADASSYYPDRVAFSLKNVGKGPALNLKIVCKDDRGNQWRLQKEIVPLGSLETVEVVLFKEFSDDEEFGKRFLLDFEYKDIFEKTHKYSEPVPRTLQEMLRTRIQ